jgi:hypothetical protein
MAKVYICTGSCHGESTQPGNCGAETCERHNQPLQAMEKCEKCHLVHQPNEQHKC